MNNHCQVLQSAHSPHKALSSSRQRLVATDEDRCANRLPLHAPAGQLCTFAYVYDRLSDWQPTYGVVQ